MPRWSPGVLQCSIFMYRTLDEAERGANYGGAGFLVGVRWEKDSRKIHTYAVTNYHVAVSGGASVVRINTKSGGSVCVETQPTEWFWRVGHDVAVHRIDQPNSFFGLLSATLMPISDLLITPEDIRKYNIGEGDEVASVGRFVDLTGHQKNQPMLRTGVISLMGPIPVRQARGVPWEQEPCHIVEMRSRTGFSGSPVYVYIDQLFARFVPTEIEIKPFEFHGPWLFGIQAGQFPLDKENADEDAYGTSMATVVPSEYLRELLMEDERVIAERREHEERFAVAPKVNLEAVEPSTKADNPRHREDFNRLLGAAARKPRQDDQT